MPSSLWVPVSHHSSSTSIPSTIPCPAATGSSLLALFPMEVFPISWHPCSGSFCIVAPHTRLLIVLVSFPIALIKYPRQELREERFYFAYNSKLQPMVVGKSRQQEPEVHSQEQPENESMHASSCSGNSLLFTWSRAQSIKMVSFIQDIGFPTSVNQVTIPHRPNCITAH